MRRRIGLWLLAPLLLLTAAGGALTALFHTEAGLQWGFRQLQARLPGRLTVERLDGRLAGPLTVAGLHYEAPGVRLQAARLVLRWRPAHLLTGRLHIEAVSADHLDIALTTAAGRDGRAGAPGFAPPVHVDTLEAEGQIPLRADGDLRLAIRWQSRYRGRVLEGGGRLGGTLRRIEIEQRLAQPLIARLTGWVTHAGGMAHWEAALDADPFSLSAVWPQARPVKIPQIALTASGAGTKAMAEARFTAQDPELGDWNGTVAAEWDGSHWRVPRFALRAREGSGRITGHAEQRRDPASAASTYLLEADWQALSWPPGGKPVLHSTHGTVRATGRPADYRFSLDGELRHRDLPPAQVTIEGRGAGATLEGTRLDGRWLGGAWTGRGGFTMTARPRWTLVLQVRHLDPAPLSPVLDGELEAGIRLAGEITAGGPRLTVGIDRLGGTLRGQPLTGRARLELHDGRLEIPELRLSAGTAGLDATARIGPRQWQLRWRLDFPDLAALHPAIGGRLRSHGELTGPAWSPQIRARVEAADLVYHNPHVSAGAGTLEAEADVDLAPGGGWRIDLATGGARLAALDLGRLRLRGGGASTRHTLQLTVENDTYRFMQALDGAFDGRRWLLRLRDGRYTHARLGAWSQPVPATLDLERAAQTLQGLCWLQDDAPDESPDDSSDDSPVTARVCLGGHRQEGRATVSGHWQALDLARLSQALPRPPALSLSGASDGAVLMTLDGRRLHDLKLAFVARDGALAYPPLAGGDGATLAFRTATLMLNGDTRHGLRGEARLEISATDRIAAEAELPQWDPAHPRPDPAQPLAARLAVRLADLGLLTPLLPELPPTPGRLQAELQAGGRLDAPRIDGRIDLALPALTLARLGITVEDVRLGAGIERNRWRLAGTLRSGTGRLEVTGSGEIRSVTQWSGRLDLSGQDLETLRLPAAFVVTSPRVTLDLRPDGITLDGRVEIPRARLEPRLLEETTAEISEDAVILGAPSAPSRAPRLSGRLELVLGEAVRIAGSGFEGRLQGRLRLGRDEPGLWLGQGEIEVREGRVRAYGRDLKVRQGRLLYAGGAVTNPAVDIVAVRAVADAEVGVRVTGTAEQPRLELFSTPAMDDADILSYLMLGRPLRQVRGEEGRLLYQAATSVALIGGELLAGRLAEEFDLAEVRLEPGAETTDTALVLGKYLSPRLYVRYVQGLVDSASAFQIRYRLNDKWTLETESGTRAGAGADLIYTFER